VTIISVIQTTAAHSQTMRHGRVRSTRPRGSSPSHAVMPTSVKYSAPRKTGGRKASGARLKTPVKA
jgi:hypothetical protein